MILTTRSSSTRRRSALCVRCRGRGWCLGSATCRDLLERFRRPPSIPGRPGGGCYGPREIENKLKVSPYIREAIVIGDRRKYLSALIGIEGDTVGDWAARRGLMYTTYADLASKPEVEELVAKWVAEVNKDLAQVETVKHFRLLPKELDQEEGELTATQKVKRAAIAKEFAELIEDMYR